MPKSSKGAPAPKLVVISDLPGCTLHTGTREQLIALGFARPDQFPEGRKRISWDYSMESSHVEGWEIKKLKGGLYKLKKFHKYQITTETPPLVKKIEIAYAPDGESNYQWSVWTGNGHDLDDQAAEELSDFFRDVLEVIENSVARSKRNPSYLKLMKPSAATGGKR